MPELPEVETVCRGLEKIDYRKEDFEYRNSLPQDD